MNIEVIRKRLAELQNATTKQTNLWKPTSGKTQIRIVPYKFNKENPFIELYFHFDIAKRPMLSPISFGRPDPIVELSNKLKKTGIKEDWKLGKKLEPKMRTFCPIIVREQEDEGVKFWGFGKTVYQELLGFMADPDYGELEDIETGRDIVVEFTTAADAGRDFPVTSIRVKPNTSKVCDMSNRALVKKILEEQKDITSIYPEPTYAELEDALEKYMNPAEGEDENGNGGVPSDSDEQEEMVIVPSKKGAAAPKSKPKETPVVEESTSGDIDETLEKFNALFKKS